MKVVWSAKANDQFLKTADCLENRFGEIIKFKFLIKVYHIVFLLESSPYLGRIETLLENAPVIYRSLVVNQNNKIVYYINKDIIEIVAFWDTRREPKSLIKDLEGSEKKG